MVQRRTARWVLNRFERKDSVTEMRTIARLSVLYKMRYRLVSHEDAKLQPAGRSYSTFSKEYSYSQPTAIRDYYKYSFCLRTITEWNQLPRETALHLQFTGCKCNFKHLSTLHFFALQSAISETHLFSFLEPSKCSVLSDRPNW